jgi:hypothetical protein
MTPTILHAATDEDLAAQYDRDIVLLHNLGVALQWMVDHAEAEGFSRAALEPLCDWQRTRMLALLQARAFAAMPVRAVPQ